MEYKVNPYSLGFNLPGNIIQLKKKFKGKSQEEILKILGIEIYNTKKNKKGLSHYGWNGSYSFKLAGIDETKLIKNVDEIKGNVDLCASHLENLGEIKRIKGDLTIPLLGGIKDLSSLKEVGGNIFCYSTKNEYVKELLEKLNFNFKALKGKIRINF